MSNTLEKIKQLVNSGDVRISEHGYEELVNDNLTAREIITGLNNAILVEDYPDFRKGATVLALQKEKNNEPVHAVWGIPKGFNRPAVLVTAYRPDPKFWNETFTERE